MFVTGSLYQTATYPDLTPGANYTNAVNILTALGIVKGNDDGTFGPDQTVTREEFTAEIARALGLSDTQGYNSAGMPFTDVTDNYAASDIAVASSLGIVKGLGDGTFAPDDPVSLTDAVTIVARALNYGYAIDSQVGYPAGYLAFAAQNGLFSGLANSTANSNLTRSDAAMLIYNALETPMMLTQYGDPTNYKVGGSGDTLLATKLGAVHLRGRVTANPVTGLYSNDKAPSNEITMSVVTSASTAATDVNLIMGRDSDADYLGYYADVYAKVINGYDSQILYIGAQSSNSTVQVLWNNISSQTTLSSLVYQQQGGTGTATASISDTATIIYNGVYYGTTHSTGVTADLLQPAYGYVTLLGRNAQYDVVFINDFRSYVVSQVSADGNTLYFQDNAYPPVPVTDSKGNTSTVAMGSIDLTPNNSVKVSVLKNGQPAQISDIAANDILTIQADDPYYPNANYVQIYDAGSVIDGTVTESGFDGQGIGKSTGDGGYAPDFVVINGNTYKLGSWLTQTPNVGDSGTFYVDAYGSVVYYETDILQKASNYAYLISYNRDSSISPLKLYMITGSGVLGTFTCKDTIQYNGTTINSAALSKNLDFVINAQQLIYFEQSSDGNVYLINTADVLADYDKPSTTSLAPPNTFTLNKDCALTYTANNPAILGDNLYTMDSSTVVFDVSSSDPTDYRVGTSGQIFVNGNVYNLQIYNADSNRKAQFVLDFGTTANQNQFYVPFNANVMVIDRIVTAADPVTGQPLLKVYGYTGGKEIAIYANSTDVGPQPDFTSSSSSSSSDDTTTDDTSDTSTDTTITDQTDQTGTPFSNILLNQLVQGSIIQYVANFDGKITYIRTLYDPQIAFSTMYAWNGSGVTSQLSTYVANVYSKSASSITITPDYSFTLAFSVTNAYYYIFDSSAKKVSVATLADVIASTQANGAASRVFVRAYKGNAGDVVILK